jgi:type VI secretion system protein ImpE
VASDADERLRSGDIEGARAALVDAVRSSPADERARMFLFQLLCVNGEWDKATAQLQALARLSPEAQMLSVVYGQVIAAEALRAEVFAGRAPIEQLVPSPWAQDLVEAIGAYASGDNERAAAARERAFDAAPDTSGTLDGQAFEWIADADSRWGPSFEAIIAGRYGMVPFDVVERIESEGPRDLRDTVWYPVQIAFRSGQSVAAFLPARYPGSERASDPAERLGRATGWSDAAWGQAGSGQHLWLLSGDEERALLSLRSLVFD